LEPLHEDIPETWCLRHRSIRAGRTFRSTDANTAGPWYGTDKLARDVGGYRRRRLFSLHALIAENRRTE
jgi:hypothetical protein